MKDPFQIYPNSLKQNRGHRLERMRTKGHQLEDYHRCTLTDIKYSSSRRHTISALQRLQKIFGHLKWSECHCIKQLNIKTKWDLQANECLNFSQNFFCLFVLQTGIMAVLYGSTFLFKQIYKKYNCDIISLYNIIFPNFGFISHNCIIVNLFRLHFISSLLQTFYKVNLQLTLRVLVDCQQVQVSRIS